MHRTALSAALSTTLGAALLTVALTASPATAAPGPLAGTWTSTDLDGSNQSLTISGSGRSGTYAAVLRDDDATTACDGGGPAKLAGRALVEGDDLLLYGSLTCQPGGSVVRELIGLGFTYDAGSDTLEDESGVTWTRG